MMRIGHYGAAMLAYVPVVVFLGPDRPWVTGLGLAATLGAARLPDLDQKLPFVPHRGPTHTLWFGLVLGLSAAAGANAVLPESDIHLLVFAALFPPLGVFSHLAADALTPAGVRPFWPLYSRSVSVALVRAENGAANRLLFGAGLLALALTLHNQVGSPT